MHRRIAVIGGGGTIGGAVARRLAAEYPQAEIFAFSRRPRAGEGRRPLQLAIDFDDEDSIATSAIRAARDGPVDLVFVATGILHGEDIAPEKSLREVSAEKFRRLFGANTVLPAMIAKHFLPRMPRRGRCVFAALSARVGSVSDNRLGGWYAYRASKAALNMVIRCAAVETAMRCPDAIVVGLHPGTVDSPLSRPYRSGVSTPSLFTPARAARHLVAVMGGLSADDTGKCFAWDGSEIAP